MLTILKKDKILAVILYQYIIIQAISDYGFSPLKCLLVWWVDFIYMFNFAAGENEDMIGKL